MKSIVTEQATPADLKKFGLDKPAVAVTLNLGSARATLALGGTAGDDSVYARDVSKPMVVTVEKSLADDLKKAADDYRRKDVFEFRAFNANRVELTRAGQTVAFERVKGEGENAHGHVEARQPERRRRRQDEDRQRSSPASPTSAPTSFTDTTAKTGLDTPALTVYVEVRRRQEGRARHVRPERQRRVLRPARRARRGEGGGREIQRSDQGARRAVEMTCGCARLFPH